jgi:hypothetical protein
MVSSLRLALHREALVAPMDRDVDAAGVCFGIAHETLNRLCARCPNLPEAPPRAAVENGS